MRPAMPVRRQFTGACGAALCVVVLGSPPARAEAQGDPAGGACGAAAVLVAVHVGVPSMQSALLCLVNRERAAAGAPALATSRRLRRAAQAHSDDMVARRYFLHTAPGGPAWSAGSAAPATCAARPTGPSARTSAGQRVRQRPPPRS